MEVCFTEDFWLFNQSQINQYSKYGNFSSFLGHFWTKIFSAQNLGKFEIFSNEVLRISSNLKTIYVLTNIPTWELHW